MKLILMLMLCDTLLIAPAAWSQAGDSRTPVNGTAASSSQTNQVPATQSQNQPDSQASAEPGQTAEPISDNGTAESGSTSPTTPWLPNAVNGETGSLTFSDGEVNFVSGGITLAGTYDDNAFSNNADKVGNVGYMVMPNISVSESRPRMNLSLSYSPGFTFDQRISPQYTAAHDLNMSFQYRLTEHMTARFHDDFIYGTNSFNGFNDNPFGTQGNVLHQPNTAIRTLLTNQLTNSSGVDLIDQIGRGTMIGASAYFSRLHFLDGSAIPGLLDNQSWSADALYSARVSSTSSVGLTYSHQDLATFGEPTQRTNSDNVLVFYTMYPKPGVTLSFFAGPSYVTTTLLSTTQSAWLVNGGATLGWRGERTAIQISAIHDVSDGGGVAAAVQTYSVNGALNRQLTRHLLAAINLSYSSDVPLADASTGRFYAVDGTAGLQRLIGQSLSFGILYGRYHQAFGTSGMLANPVADHNQGWVSVSYRFSRPLGK